MKEEQRYGDFLNSLVEVPIKKAVAGSYAQGSPGNYPFMPLMCKILEVTSEGFIVENKATTGGTWLFRYSTVIRCFDYRPLNVVDNKKTKG